MSRSTSCGLPESKERFLLITSMSAPSRMFLTPRVKMPLEPLAGQAGNPLQRARFLEQVRGAGNDLHAFLTLQRTHGLFVHLDDGMVLSADDQKRRRLDSWKGGPRQIGTSAAGNNRSDTSRPARGCHQCGAASCACAEVSDRQMAYLSV